MRYSYKLYGAILGDLAGQAYEFPKMQTVPSGDINLHNPKAHITDDTLMTLASAASLMNGTTAEQEYKAWGLRYDDDYVGFGSNFRKWLYEPLGTVNDSYGNGCIMRASPFMYVDNGLEKLILSIVCSHRHMDSILACVDLYKAYHYGLRSYEKRPIERFAEFRVESKPTIDFCLNVCATYDELITKSEPDLEINRICQAAMIKAIECSGDTDTNASIIGEYMNYKYKFITPKDAEFVESKLDTFQLETLLKFNKKSTWAR